MAGLKIGLLGGSFNPAHAGHRHISLIALRRLGLDQVWWLVSPQNPLKPSTGMASLARRLASARTAARHPRIKVGDLETQLDTRYTVDTLRALKRRHANMRFIWLMGADNLVQLPCWREWTGLMELVPVAVFDRAPYSYDALAGLAARRFGGCRVRIPGMLIRTGPPAWCFLRERLETSSATQLRKSRAWIA